MFRNFFIIVVIAAAFTACNNNGDKTATAADTTDHAGMDHGSADIPDVPAVPEGARVYFVNLKDGDKVSSPVKVEMGVEGMSVDTANGIIKPASGHHHIFVDGPDSLVRGTVVPKDSVHLHYGNAQTATELSLAPGKHTLTLQYADALHRSYGSALATKISIEVK